MGKETATGVRTMMYKVIPLPGERKGKKRNRQENMSFFIALCFRSAYTVLYSGGISDEKLKSFHDDGSACWKVSRL
jgi:hypothetical protein